MNPLTLSTPDTSLDLDALDRAKLADGTRRHYKQAARDMIQSGINPFDYTDLTNYANSLSSSGKSNLKASLKIICRDFINRAKTSNKPIETIQRFLWLVEAMEDAITISQPDSQRDPHWLSQEQVDRITSLALENSMRDYIVLAVLLGAGLRREELENLTFDSLKQIPDDGRMVDVLVIRGKGDKKRTIPISNMLASRLYEWKQIVKGGRVARSIHKSGAMGDSLSHAGIFDIVRKYGALIDIPNLDPHDLRRTYGRLMYENTKDIMLTKNLLGHSSVRTTEIYIGLHLNLNIAESAFPVRDYVVQVAGD